MSSPYPDARPVAITDENPRCRNCSGKIAWYVTRPWKLMCRKCRVTNYSPDHSQSLILSTT